MRLVRQHSPLLAMIVLTALAAAAPALSGAQVGDRAPANRDTFYDFASAPAAGGPEAAARRFDSENRVRVSRSVPPRPHRELPSLPRRCGRGGSRTADRAASFSLDPILGPVVSHWRQVSPMA
jgi:hypothetical protein